ncbi:hypothetical protein [Brevibacillus fulvus]|uniref:Uncharacterized protein n=1 Tax=Brevibacillus fulvus TaxID=1125967 RepID=A0A938XY18_9BACL|nr:hypothetical protein [Brevibacillus fulvus]MBM7589961.1 hypothetical protein [Brevibacillus fulvus]
MVGRSLMRMMLAGGVVAAVGYMMNRKRRNRLMAFGLNRLPMMGRNLSRVAVSAIRQTVRAR